MAKFAQNEPKAFSPIDAKLLGGLAETPVAESVQVEPDPPSVPQPVAPAVQRKDRPQPSKPSPELKRPIQPKRPVAPVAKKPPQNERLNRVVKCLFTPSEDQELRNLVNRLRERTGITLSFSHLMRPFFALLLLSEQELAEELADAGLRRPINDQNALAAFEHELAAVIHSALRRTEPEAGSKKV